MQDSSLKYGDRCQCLGQQKAKRNNITQAHFSTPKPLFPPFHKLILTHNLGCWIQGGKKKNGS